MQNITYDQSQAMNNGLTKWTVLYQFKLEFVNQNYSDPDSGTPSHTYAPNNTFPNVISLVSIAFVV